MTAEHILQSDVLDILFEDRNKRYGAYELRRAYPGRVRKAIGMMLLFVGVSSAAYLFVTARNTTIVLPPDALDTITTVISDVEPPEPKPRQEQAAPAAAVELKTAMVKNVTPVIVPNDQIDKTEVPDVVKIDSSLIGNRDFEGPAADPGTLPPADGELNGKPGGTGQTPAAAVAPVLPEGPIDMAKADELPEYPGGKLALVRFMVNQLTSELEPGVKYVVKAQFVINEDGNVSEAKILSSDDAVLNAQVLRALNRMKTWKPGTFNGRKVAVRFVMPVTFVGPEM